jgi:hypothetical protein
MTVTEVADGAYGPSGVVPCRGRAREPVELVGRDQDMNVIQEFVDELPAQGGTLLLSGEPGVGKMAAETRQPRYVAVAKAALAVAAAERGDPAAGELAAEPEAVLLPMGASPLLALVELARGRTRTELRAVLEPTARDRVPD